MEFCPSEMPSVPPNTKCLRILISELFVIPRYWAELMTMFVTSIQDLLLWNLCSIFKEEINILCVRYMRYRLYYVHPLLISTEVNTAFLWIIYLALNTEISFQKENKMKIIKFYN
jgi:hypothetical protein